MKKPKIYLDNCTFNRPFDDQARLEIKFEAEAKLHIQEMIRSGTLDLVWSYILEYENAQNPFPFRRYTIYQWKKIAKQNVLENNDIIKKAEELEEKGLKAKDALHVACAMVARAEYFITTDKEILKKMKDSKEIKVIDPVNFILQMEERE
jgi:predicted nucleic acid-binding protein